MVNDVQAGLSSRTYPERWLTTSLWGSSFAFNELAKRRNLLKGLGYHPSAEEAAEAQDVVDGGVKPSPSWASRHLLQPPETMTTGPWEEQGPWASMGLGRIA